MKLLPPVATLIILVLYWLMTILAWRIIRLWMNDREHFRRKLVMWLYFGAAVLVTLIFLFLYAIRPSQSSASYYFFHTLFNALLIADLLSKLPLTFASLVALFRLRDRTKKVIVRMGLMGSAGLFLLLLTGILYGTTSLTVRKHTLVFADLPPAFDGLRIVHFSDSHLGSYSKTKLLEKMTSVTQSFRPDLICFTGDLVNNYGTEAVKYINELRQFNSAAGKFAILGNHDYGDYTKWPDSLAKAANFLEISDAIRESGFRLLCNETERVVRNGDTLYLTGFCYPGHRPVVHRADMELAVSRLPDSCFCIALCHDPEFWNSDLLRDKRFGLTLSGHTHGLQWGIYPAGIALSMARLIRENWAGLYRDGERCLYVNRGTGVVGMLFRIDMPAEITLLTLKRVEIN